MASKTKLYNSTKKIGADDEQEALSNLENLEVSSLIVSGNAEIQGNITFSTLNINTLGAYQQTGAVDFNNQDSIYILEPGNEPMGMFEFTKYGIILMLIGLTYILFIAPMLLPSRTSTSSLTKSYHLGGYLTEMKVTEESPLNGTTCMDRGINKNYDVTVLDILRDGKMIQIAFVLLD